METAQWIESSAAPDAGKTRKRIYQVLPMGRQELLRWTALPSAPLDLRDEFMVRLRADAAIGPLGLEAELQRRLAQHQEKLAIYREIELRDFPAGRTLSREARIHHLILQKGILFEEGSINWTLQVLQELAPD
jgi:DNA-binding PadR family transcriptional regulator